MNNLFKSEYLLLAFLMVNMTAEYAMLAPVSKMLFYVVLALSIPVCLANASAVREGFRACPYLSWWIAIYVIYQFTVGCQYATPENLVYMIAKIATFAVMAMSIGKDFDFYAYRLSKPMGIVIVALLLLGFNGLSYAGGRSFGFYNGNAGCAVATIGVACFLFKEDAYKKWELFCLLFCIMCVVMGSSRNSLAMLVILLVLRYGISQKLLLVCGLSLVTVVFILPALGVEVSSVNRLLGTFDGTVAMDRDKEREAARWMIAQHQWEGNGFNFKNYGYALQLTKYGAHNGYLNILEQMGIGFGGLWLTVLFIGVWNNLKLYWEDNIYVRKYLGIMLAILFGANQESYLSGVNQFTTNMLYVSMVILWMYRYNQKNELMA